MEIIFDNVLELSYQFKTWQDYVFNHVNIKHPVLKKIDRFI